MAWEAIHKRLGPFAPHMLIPMPKMIGIIWKNNQAQILHMHCVPVYVCGMLTRLTMDYCFIVWVCFV